MFCIILIKSSFRFKPARQQNYTMTAEEVETKLRLKIRDGFQGLREAFYKIDDDHNGKITAAIT